ncbi:unnamed protein product, partial [Ectocarpus sp. 12 AP-2014]
ASPKSSAIAPPFARGENLFCRWLSIRQRKHAAAASQKFLGGTSGWRCCPSTLEAIAQQAVHVHAYPAAPNPGSSAVCYSPACYLPPRFASVKARGDEAGGTGDGGVLPLSRGPDAFLL